MIKKLPDHIDGLVRYLSSPDEKANEDLILKYFRKTFGEDFTRQKEANGSDGYLPGHFVLELKGKTNDWLAGLFQGIAYRKNLDFGVVIVATNKFLGLWSFDDLGEALIAEVLTEKTAPNAVGRKLSTKYKTKKSEILKKAFYTFPTEYLDGLINYNSDVVVKEVSLFENNLKQRKKIRYKVNIRNFTKILKQMTDYFPADKPIKTVRAFYSMIYGPWNQTSTVQINQKKDDCATIGGIEITDLVPSKRQKFKDFVESHFVDLGEGENIDDFFSKYDEAIDVVDRNFRIRNGIYFTDLDLSKFAMWYVKQTVPSLGKNYLVIDPACGSGNLVTNWRSPLELRHKVVSEIEPELLFAVEQRMKGDQWHNGKFTVVPKVNENIGLNFLDKSASDYLDILKKYLEEKGQKPDKPLAFLCNPPYRSDDDQKSTGVKYDIDEDILKSITKDASSDRYLCFLAQMKLICDQAVENGIPDKSLLLLFTQTSWLTKRPVVLPTRQLILGSFQEKGAFVVNGAEFFDVKGKFPIAFSMWEYVGQNKKLNPDRAIPVLDLTHLKKEDLQSLPWADPSQLDQQIKKLIKGAGNQWLGVDRQSVSGEWAGVTRRNLYRNLTKDEKRDSSQTHLGLPKGDRRQEMKTTHGYSRGTEIGFLLDKTPCRTFLKPEEIGKPWVHADSRFMMVGTTRIMSGIPDRGYCVVDEQAAFKLFTWYSLARTFFSVGYPMWANMLEMWTPNISENKVLKMKQIVYSMAFADNECIQTEFSQNNPVRGAPSISNHNPMSPLSDTSFWNTQLAKFFEGESKCQEATDLVLAVNLVFKEWKKRFKAMKELTVSYDAPYFINENKLTIGSGLVQIKEYAEQTDDARLKELLIVVSEKSSELKKLFHKMLLAEEGLHYFELPKQKVMKLNEAPAAQVANRPTSEFDLIIEKRVSLACKIVEQMNEAKEFNRVKFAKAFYLADMVSGVDLKTEYIRDAAGPIDHRSLYNEKIGIESLAAKSGFFSAEKKRGKEFDFVQYTTGSNLGKGSGEFSRLFGKSAEKVNEVIKLTAPMTMNQIEIVATLYACWNDFLIAKKRPSDQDLVKEFRDKWHPDKTKKFKADKGKKPRFTEKQLIDAIEWMRVKGLSPQGFGKKTKSKINKADVIPF
jgi:hypothetical protein